jgi:hypothetical protein
MKKIAPSGWVIFRVAGQKIAAFCLAVKLLYNLIIELLWEKRLAVFYGDSIPVRARYDTAMVYLNCALCVFLR